jgi:hypothetical protein
LSLGTRCVSYGTPNEGNYDLPAILRGAREQEKNATR